MGVHIDTGSKPLDFSGFHPLTIEQHTVAIGELKSVAKEESEWKFS